MRIREIKRKIKREHKILDVVERIVDIVADLPPNKRSRVVKAAAILHGIDL